jgi:hypothetical protein
VTTTGVAYLFSMDCCSILYLIEAKNLIDTNINLEDKVVLKGWVLIGTEYKRYMKNGLLCNKEYDEVL